MRVAIEAGTHSSWVSRVLKECGHKVLVANARKVRLIYGEGHKNDKLNAENLARLARLDPKLPSRILGEVVIAALRRFTQQLEVGALITVDEGTSRARNLPINR